MYLVLIRHGDAEKLTGDMKDQDRELTRAGYRAMRAVLPEAVELFPADGSISIWTSPLIRARQTAEIATERIRNIWGSSRVRPGSPRIVPSLAETSVDGILTDLAEEITQSGSDENTLVLVGHDPQFSRLATFFTGTAIDVKKGTALCLEADDSLIGEVSAAGNPEDTNRLLDGSLKMRWLVAGPNFRRWQTLVDLEKILADGFSDVLEACDRFHKHPDDEDAVHDLRVSIRMLRSLVSFIEPFQKKKQNRRMQHALRSIVGLLSHLRDLDVLIEESKKVDPDALHLRPELEALRREECVRVQTAFSRRRTKDYLDLARQDFRRIEWKKKVEHEGLRVKDVESRFEEWTDTYQKDYRHVDFKDHEASHALRKQAKRLRYAAAGLEPVVGSRRDVLKAMRKMQDKLGALCDARVGAQLLKEIGRNESLSDAAQKQISQLIEMEHDEEEHLIKDLSADLI